MSDPPNTFIDLTKDESSSSKPVNQTSFPITVPKDVGLQQEKADESLSDVGFNVGFPLMMSDSMKSGTSIINNVVSSELQCAADESAILEQPSLQLSSILKSQPNPQQGWLAALSQRTLERVHLSSSPIVLPTSKIDSVNSMKLGATDRSLSDLTSLSSSTTREASDPKVVTPDERPVTSTSGASGPKGGKTSPLLSLKLASPLTKEHIKILEMAISPSQTNLPENECINLAKAIDVNPQLIESWFKKRVSVPYTDSQPVSENSTAQSSLESTPDTGSPTDSPAVKNDISIRDRLNALLSSNKTWKASNNFMDVLRVMASASDQEERLEVLHELVKVTEKDFHQSFVGSKAVQLVRGWLVSAVKESKFTLATACLQLFKSLPMNIDVLKASQLGKVVKSLTKSSDRVVQQLSEEIMNSWMAIIRASASDEIISPIEGGSSFESKRQLEDEKEKPKKKSRKYVDESKKIRIIEQPPAQPTAASKLASKRPAEPILVRKPAPNRPAGIDIFDQVFNELDAPKSKKVRALPLPDTRTAEPVRQIPDPSPLPEMRRLPTISTKTGKPKKRVTWAPDGILCKIKVFHSGEVHHVSRFKNAREMDRNEAKNALSVGMTPTMDWTFPRRLDFSPSIEKLINAEMHSEERKIQLEREKVALGAVYLTESDIPLSAAEPVESQSDVFHQVKLIPLDTPATTPIDREPTPKTLDPLSVIQNIMGNVQPQAATSSLQPVDNQLISNLLSQIKNTVGPTAPSHPPSLQIAPTVTPNTNHPVYLPPQPSFDYSMAFAAPVQSMLPSMPPSSGMMGRGAGIPKGSGAGIPKTKQICKFFAEGHCRFGNQCKFRHH